MKESFIEKRFSPERLGLIGASNEIVEKYLTAGYRLTLRQLFYQLVVANLLRNVERSYKILGEAISDGRLAGLIDWEAIEDRIRQPFSHPEFENLEELVKAALQSYRLPRWADQEHYVELWVEKDALAGVLRPLALAYHVTLMVNRGYCVSPEVRVLTADLRWVSAADVKPGLELLGVDEAVPGYKKHRRLKRTVVSNAMHVLASRVRVVTDQGDIVVSRNHPFLATPHSARHDYLWIHAERLRPGGKIAYLARPWEEDRSWEAGWLAGMFDGEGWLNAAPTSREIAVCQAEGIVANRLRSELQRRGLLSGESLDKASGVITFRSYSIQNVLTVLGQLRPLRLLAAFQSQLAAGKWPAKGKGNPAIVLGVEMLADGLVVGLETDARTLITEGYVSHNSSQSAMYEAANRFKRAEDGGKETVLLYLGDHDPSGEDMVRDIRARLERFGATVDVQKIALTMAQVKQYNPPPNPAKMSDSRAASYVAEHGTSSWEVDALPPDVLHKLIERSIHPFFDVKAWNKVVKQEEADKKALTHAVKGLGA